MVLKKGLLLLSLLYYCHAGVYLELKGTVYSASSNVSITEVGEGEDALLCKTNKDDCCARSEKRFGDFYYPSGVRVPVYSHGQSFYHNKGDKVVSLNRRADSEELLASSGDKPLLLGEYCCEAPDACGDMQRVCINLV